MTINEPPKSRGPQSRELEEKASVEPVLSGPVKEPASDDWKPLTRTARWIWITVAIASGVYVFIPEPTDLFPPLGWLDEGLAVLIFTYALERLGVHIPLIDRIVHWRRLGRR